MKNFVIALVLAGLVVLSLGVRPSYAGEIDLLLQKLVDKGILTPGEAQQIGTETKEQVKQEISAGKYSSLPQWIQNTKLKGDFRFRYENGQEEGQTQDSSAARIRARVGIESKINDNMKVGIGVATGTTSNPRSTNVTLGNQGTANTPASFKSIILDYAYGQYTPNNNFTFIGGKFKNSLWQPTDLLWDTDLNPEGVAINLAQKLNNRWSFFMNNLWFAMKNDTRSDAQSMMFAIQPGVDYTVNDKTNLRAAMAGYLFTGVQGKAKFNNWATNSLSSANTYLYNYNSLNPSFLLSIKEPFRGLVPYLGIYGDYIYNVSAKHPSSYADRYGFDAGIAFGDEKVGDWKQWQAKIMYSKLGRDSFLDIFPDSDRYSGKTNMKAIEAIYEFGLGKSTSFVLDYYYGTSLTKSGPNNMPQQVIQADWNLKF